MSEPDCLFCRIIAGEIPADFIHRDDRSVVIRDINPQAPTHYLVVPQEHIESLDDASQKEEGLLGYLLRVAAKVANAAGLTVKDLDEKVPFGRIGRPQEVAALVAFLASDEAAFICGSAVEITGAQAVS